MNSMENKITIRLYYKYGKKPKGFRFGDTFGRIIWGSYFWKKQHKKAFLKLKGFLHINYFLITGGVVGCGAGGGGILTSLTSISKIKFA